VRRRTARKPAAAGAARGLHGNAKAGELKRSEAYSIRLHAVYSGRVCIGFLLPRGRLGVEAFDADDHSLGIFPTVKAAADAISAKVAS
jgi:hypothetical protein